MLLSYGGNLNHKPLKKIKNVLSSLATMIPPILGKPMILYLTSTEKSIGALLPQEHEGIENPVYYLSRLIRGAKCNYSSLEKHCLALLYVAQNLRHYLLAHHVTLMTQFDPIKFLLRKPALVG